VKKAHPSMDKYLDFRSGSLPLNEISLNGEGYFEAKYGTVTEINVEYIVQKGRAIGKGYTYEVVPEIEKKEKVPFKVITSFLPSYLYFLDNLSLWQVIFLHSIPILLAGILTQLSNSPGAEPVAIATRAKCTSSVSFDVGCVNE